jgi:hypothetical protein
MSDATWEARLLIRHEQNLNANPEADGQPVTLEVGIPKGRLQATESNGTKHWLRVHTGDEGIFLPDIIAPTEREVRDDARRWVIVPGRDTSDRATDWHLYLNGASIDAYEGFLQRLQEEGCQPPIR